jgi:glutamate racemase
MSMMTSVNNKVAQKAWSGTNINVYHFIVFGCIDFSHILEEMRKKLTAEVTFIQYSKQSKAYMLYIRVTKKFLVSRDAKFLENKSWNEKENETLDSQNPLQQNDEKTKN